MFFFFKQKTAYEMRISDWSSDVCSSDLPAAQRLHFSVTTTARAKNPRFGTPLKFHPGVGFESQLPVERLSQPPLAFAQRQLRHLVLDEIGRASCRERVCQYV